MTSRPLPVVRLKAEFFNELQLKVQTSINNAANVSILSTPSYVYKRLCIVNRQVSLSISLFLFIVLYPSLSTFLSLFPLFYAIVLCTHAWFSISFGLYLSDLIVLLYHRSREQFSAAFRAHVEGGARIAIRDEHVSRRSESPCLF